MPPEAVAAGVEWSIDGGMTWYASGTTVVLPVGNYTVIFKPVPGYTLPAIANVAIGGSKSVNMTGDPDLAGDISGDSTIDLSDVIIALQVISGIEIYPIGAWYDVNGDGKIGMAEAIHVLQKMASE